MQMSYDHISTLFQDDVVGSCVAECLDLLDYGAMVDGLMPPPLRRQHGVGSIPVSMVGGTHDNPIDLTDDDVDSLPVATRLDFTLIVDEIDNGGLFQRQPR